MIDTKPKKNLDVCAGILRSNMPGLSMTIKLTKDIFNTQKI